MQLYSVFRSIEAARLHMSVRFVKKGKEQLDAAPNDLNGMVYGERQKEPCVGDTRLCIFRVSAWYGQSIVSVLARYRLTELMDGT